MDLRKKTGLRISFIIALTLLFSNTLMACTSFILKDSDRIVFGRNYDFDFGLGLIVINNRGHSKQAMVKPPYKPASWQAKYGSITFNQIGIDTPMDGMNEKGLVIAQMGMASSQYPQAKQENVLNQLEWIQYQLDMSATVEEVIENTKNISINPFLIPVHYLVCDRFGSAAVIEYDHGELKVYQGTELIEPVCGNVSYNLSVEKIKSYKEFGGEDAIPQKNEDIEMYAVATASKMVNDYKTQGLTNPLAYSFDILNATGMESRTQWSVVYDLDKLLIHFNSIDNKELRTMDMKQYNFTCTTAVQIMDIHENNSGLLSQDRFAELTFNDYLVYKLELQQLFKTHFNGFPDIPYQQLKAEVEHIMNRKCDMER